MPIGQKITGGLGAGGNPKVGEDAAIEDTERLKLVIGNANMVVITAGMGGGTGTGSAPIVAKLAHEAGILTIAVVTTPFEHEGVVRMNNAMEGLAKLRQNVDSLIVLPNDKIFKAMKTDPERKLTFREQFILADNLLCAGVKGVTEIITKPGDINVDFADALRQEAQGKIGVVSQQMDTSKVMHIRPKLAALVLAVPLDHVLDPQEEIRHWGAFLEAVAVIGILGPIAQGLHEFGNPHIGGAGKAGNAVVIIQCSVIQGLGMSGFRPEKQGVFLPLMQIGRASCRERV